MPKCKNCYHKAICAASLESLKMEGCDYFKDKSLVVELPCKVGDIVYQIDGEIYPIKISDIAISDSDTEFNGCEIDDEGNEFDEYSIQLSEFGETVFLTRAEAEKALEDRENE